MHIHIHIYIYIYICMYIYIYIYTYINLIPPFAPFPSQVKTDKLDREIPFQIAKTYMCVYIYIR